MEILYAMIIFIMPLLFTVKGGYYMYVSNALTDKRLDKMARKYSGIKMETPLDFYEKNRFIAKVYFTIGSVIIAFVTIFNICYISFSIERIIYMFVILFFVDFLLEQLAIVKCKLSDYDSKQKNEGSVKEDDKSSII